MDMMHNLKPCELEMLLEKSRGIVVSTSMVGAVRGSSLSRLLHTSALPLSCAIPCGRSDVLSLGDSGGRMKRVLINGGTRGHPDFSITAQIIADNIRAKVIYEDLFKETFASHHEPVVVYIKPKKGEGRERGYGLGKHNRGRR